MPDISTLPASPRLNQAPPSQIISSNTASNTASRRASQIMGPPQQPASATYTARSPVMSTNENISVPMRHPRPLTAAELYLECEKEQEAVVCMQTCHKRYGILTCLLGQSLDPRTHCSTSPVCFSSQQCIVCFCCLLVIATSRHWRPQPDASNDRCHPSYAFSTTPILFVSQHTKHTYTIDYC